eukprot:PhM_4_TR1692/c1_g1_i1/m.19021
MQWAGHSTPVAFYPAAPFVAAVPVHMYHQHQQQHPHVHHEHMQQQQQQQHTQEHDHHHHHRIHQQTNDCNNTNNNNVNNNEYYHKSEGIGDGADMGPEEAGDATNPSTTPSKPPSRRRARAPEVIAAERELEAIATQRVIVEEKVRQLILEEQRLLFKIVEEGKTLSADVVLGHVAVLGSHPQGSGHLTRMITSDMHTMYHPDVERLLSECVDASPALAVDVHGCKVLLRLIERGTEYHLSTLISTLGENMYMTCTHPVGCTVVVALVERVTTHVGLRTLLTSTLRACVTGLVKDLHGARVLQRCMEKWSNADGQFIYVALLGHCQEMSCNRHACCVLQSSLEYATETQRHVLAKEVLEGFPGLVCDPFGNYIIQYIMDLNVPSFNVECIRHTQGNVAALSMNKFGSNVVERCLRVATPDIFAALFREIFLGEPATLSRLLTDSYGNYVVQTALALATAEQLVDARSAITPYLHVMKRTPCGRKIQERLFGRTRRSKKKKGAAQQQQQQQQQQQ